MFHPENVQFSCLTAEEWTRYSVAEINRPYSKSTLSSKNSDDKEGTPYDGRMGALENLMSCETCGLTNESCPGHFGHINLEVPILNKLFMPYILKILQCVCSNCSRLRVKPEHLNVEGHSRTKSIKRMKFVLDKCSRVTVCPWCFLPLFSYEYNKRTDSIQKYFGNKKRSKKIQVQPEQILKIFRKMTDEDVNCMGFNDNLSQDQKFTDPDYLYDDNCRHVHQFRPESLVLTVLPVIPPVARPFSIRDAERFEDDITEKYNAIIKINNQLSTNPNMATRKKYKKLTEAERKKKISELDFQITTMMNNHNDKSRLSSGGRPYKCLKKRLRGKEGHFQTNVCGKRVDYSGRTVIVGGGVELKSHQIGLPREIADVLTIPQIVNSNNIDYLNSLVQKGDIPVVRRGSAKLHPHVLIENGGIFELNVGDRVDVKAKDGNVVFINRQPSLRIESIQSFEIVVTDDLAMKLPLAVTGPYGADFDGDEMNIHVMQSMMAYAEMMILSRSAAHIVTPQKNSPVIGIIQDGLVASYILTNIWNEGDVCTMVKKKHILDIYDRMGIGKERLKKFMKRVEVLYPECVKNGNLTDVFPGKIALSIIFPENLCYTKRTNIHSDFPDTIIENGIITPSSGPISKADIGAKSNSIIHIMWKYYGPEPTSKLISEIQLFTDYWLVNHGFTIGPSDCKATNSNEIAKHIASVHLQADIALQSGASDAKINSILNSAMVINLSMVNGNMIKGDRNGLNIARRSGAKGNPINSQQIAAFLGQQNIDGGRPPKTLTNKSRTLPHFKPGDNSAEARGFVFSNYIDGLSADEAWFHAASGREGIIATAIKTAGTGYLHKKIARKLEDYKACIDGTVRDSKNRILQFLYGSDGMDARKIIYNSRVKFPLFVDVVRVAQMINTGTEKLPADVVEFLLSYICVGIPGVQNYVTKYSSGVIQNILRNELEHVKIDPQDIPEFCARIRHIFESSKIQYGEMVGLIAASSLGEIGTQLTLNTFHNTGVGKKDVSSGVPRLTTLLNATKNVKTVSSTIYLKGEYEFEDVFRMRYCFELTTLSIITTKTETLRIDQSVNCGLVNYPLYKKEWWSGDTSKKSDVSWVVRFHLNVEEMFYRNMDIYDVVEKINKINEIEKVVAVEHSPTAVGIIDIFPDLTIYEVDPDEYYKIVRDVIRPYLLDIQLGGMKGIEKTYIEKDNLENLWRIQTDGSNLIESMVHPSTDFTRTISDNVWEIYEVLGIEAAREYLYEELTRVLCFDGAYINPRHVELLVEAMTFTGDVTSVNRNGIPREAGPLAKIMFERAVDNAVKASVFGERDPLKSVPSSIMFGLNPPCGTGKVEIINQ